MKSFEFGLASRVALGAMMFIVLSSAILLFVENRRYYDSRVKVLSTDLEQELEAADLRINHRVNTMSQDVLFLSDLPPIPAIISATLNHGYDAHFNNSQEVWLARLEQIYTAFLKAHKNYARVRFIGVSGGGKEILRIDNRNGVIGTATQDMLQATADRDFFKATVGLKEGQVYLSDIDLNQELRMVNGAYRPTLRAATPVFTPAGKIFGMVVININIDSLLNPVISKLPDMRTILANANGQYLLRTDANLEAELNLSNKVSDEFPFIASISDPRTPSYLPLQLASSNSGAFYFAAKRIQFDPDNPTHIILLLCTITHAALTGQVATTPTTIIFTEFLLMLLIGGTVMIYLKRTFAPLKQIADAAEKITAGVHDIKLLPENGAGEIRSLARAINNFIAESHLRESVQKELNDLTMYLQSALENQRTHIARELHDELGQSMTALRFDLQWLHENISTKELSVHDKLQAMNDMLSRTVDATRRISEDLRPGMLDNLGLAAAIENYVVKFKAQSGINCDLSMNQADFDLDDQVATALFRIVQESLTNVARHSGANHVDIRLHELEDTILLIVQDNGRGLPDSPDARKKTFGLLGMRERVKMLGGTLDVFNEKGAGLRIEACVPKIAKG